MSTTDLSFLDVCLVIVSAMLILAVLLAFVRLVLGPTLPDRVVALDTIATLVMAVTVVYAIATHQSAFMDAATILALFAFLGTVAFMRFIERSGRME